MDERDIGKLGERKFSSWCSEVGITCNSSSDEDKEAWDYIIEFEIEDNNYHTFDEKQPKYKCFVQIKSSDDKKYNMQISLRNWEKMVINPNPFFILRIEFDGKNQPQRCYLIHVDEDIITRVLKKLRQIPKDQSFQLNKMMSYPRGKKDLVKSLDGIGIKEAFLKYLKKDMFLYNQWKAELIKTVGYDAPEYTFSISIDNTNEKEVEEIIVDFALGKHKSVPIIEAKERRKRFGIVSKEKNLGPGKLSIINNPYDKCQLRITNRNGGFCSIELDFYRPELALNLVDPKYFKYIARDKVIEIQAYPSKNLFEFSYQIPSVDKQIDLSMFDNYLRIMDFFHTDLKESRELKFNFYLTGLEEPFGFEITEPPSFSEEVIAEYQAIKNAQLIHKKLEIPRTEKVTLRQIYSQRERFQFISELIQGEEKVLVAEYTSKDKEDLSIPGEYGMSVAIAGALGNNYFCFGIIGTGKFLEPALEEGTYKTFFLSDIVKISKVNITRNFNRKKQLRKETIDFGEKLLKEKGVNRVLNQKTS